MDLRFVAFDLIARDATLRTLLVNYVQRLETDGAPEDRAASCFVSLRWGVDERPSAPPGCELLTIQVHVPSDQACSLARLDQILHRLRMALGISGPNPCITARCLTTSGTLADSRFRTLFKSSTWEIAPEPAQPRPAAPPELVQWPTWGEPGGADLLAAGVVTFSMN